ncbi:MAG: M61 family metallopeptidase [Vicinamibacterales bacterium]
MTRFAPVALVAALLTLAAAPVAAQSRPVEYRLTFPAPEHRWMQVEATFPDVPAGPLEVRMSRTSPGRYALHEFAKNVFDVRIRDGKGTALSAARPNLHQWTVTGHDGTVVVSYRVYGDRTDGTYLSVDPAHAHINMPAALMWARGLETRPARVTFVRPEGRPWTVATQLFPTGDPFVYTAPNLQYLFDSPTEFSVHALRTFQVARAAGPAPTFRVSLHHDGTDAEADRFARDVEAIVREEAAVYGELADYDTGTYTFLSDYLPWANGDGMEHRNSTVLTSSGALRNPDQRLGLLGTVAHEFFHSWNIERIRPKTIEPFDFEHANMSGELWLGEGFTSYYDALILRRTGIGTLDRFLQNFEGVINTIALSPGRALRTAQEMSQLAPFVDAAVSVDRTAWPNVFISYYTWGEGLGLALDLSLRGRSGGTVTLDDYMRAMWTAYGKPGEGTPGVVTTPYTIDDARAMLAKVSGDPAFADGFFDRYVQGHDLPDYAALLAPAGFVARPRHADGAWLGNVRFAQTAGSGARVAALVPFGSPLYDAGVEQDDQIVSLDGAGIGRAEDVEAVLGRHAPGDAIPIRFVRRTGESVDGTVVLAADPRIEIVPVEQTGATLSPDQKRFRDQWLDSRLAR